MLKIFIFLTFLSISTLYSRVYYISTNGDNNKECQSEKSACRIEKFLSLISKIEAGDTISFERGQHFFLKKSQKLKFVNLQATQNRPILINSYGEGEKPIIDTKIAISSKWKRRESNLWCTPLKDQTARLWIEQKEQKRGSLERLSDTVPWQWRDENLCIYSNTSPKKISVNGTDYPLLFQNSSYIYISDLDIQGGANGSIRIKNSNNITIKKCIIGKDSGYGITVKDAKQITIKNNLIDANFKIYYKQRFKGVARGANDGVFLGRSVTFSNILYNEFRGWGHSGVSASSQEPSEIAYNQISFNYFSAKGLSYGRGIDYSGNVHHNTITYNYIKDTSTQNQLNGYNNYFAYNIIDGVLDTPLKRGEQGNGISLEDYQGDNHHNQIVHNIIKDTQGSAIAFIALGEKSLYRVIDNNISSNIFINCGKGSRYRTLYIPAYSDIKEQYIQNNTFIKSQTRAISYRDQTLTIKEFNNKTDNKIRGNIERSISYQIEEEIEQRRAKILDSISW